MQRGGGDLSSPFHFIIVHLPWARRYNPLLILN
jgi:hypothetical protein